MVVTKTEEDLGGAFSPPDPRWPHLHRWSQGSPFMKSPPQAMGIPQTAGASPSSNSPRIPNSTLQAQVTAEQLSFPPVSCPVLVRPQVAGDAPPTNSLGTPSSKTTAIFASSNSTSKAPFTTISPSSLPVQPSIACGEGSSSLKVTDSVPSKSISVSTIVSPSVAVPEQEQPIPSIAVVSLTRTHPRQGAWVIPPPLSVMSAGFCLQPSGDSLTANPTSTQLWPSLSDAQLAKGKRKSGVVTNIANSTHIPGNDFQPTGTQSQEKNRGFHS